MMEIMVRERPVYESVTGPRGAPTFYSISNKFGTIGAPIQSNTIIADAASTRRVAGSKNIGNTILQSAINVFNDIFYLNWHRLGFKGPSIPDCSNQ